MKIKKGVGSQFLLDYEMKVANGIIDDSEIEIFSERLSEYIYKLNESVNGRYELDFYDMQVLAVAMDQFK